ncbi:HU family DNA-binding protein [Desulfobacca acetoxidans]|uniref:HU family DNA-binding protein n=1 Tax=Desulfobacca acetoxidans TaxID=60893 RepID=UPI0009FE38FA
MVALAEAEKALNTLIQTIITTLQAGGRLSLPGFGVFSLSKRPAQSGLGSMTPLTLQPIPHPSFFLNQ